MLGPVAWWGRTPSAFLNEAEPNQGYIADDDGEPVMW
jgi:hypothetical protein